MNRSLRRGGWSMARTPLHERLALAAQEKIRNDWLARVLERQRDASLESDARECSSCAILERHYDGDYICYRCRESLRKSGDA